MTDPDLPRAPTAAPTSGAAGTGDLPPDCSYCGRPFVAGEDQLLQMRAGRVVAVYHERCHPNYRRSGCTGC